MSSVVRCDSRHWEVADLTSKQNEEQTLINNSPGCFKNYKFKNYKFKNLLGPFCSKNKVLGIFSWVLKDYTFQTELNLKEGIQCPIVIVNNNTCILVHTGIAEIQWINPNIQFFPCNKTRYCAYIHRVCKKVYKTFVKKSM